MPTETLDGFVSRLAAANGAPSSYAFRKHMGIRLDKRLDDDRILTTLSNLTGLSADALALHHVRWEAKWVLFGKHRLTGRTLHWSSPRYCARCLEQDIATGGGGLEARPWIRVGWLATHNEICVHHGTRIFTSATSYTKADRYDFSLRLREHRNEWETALSDCETFDLHPYDRYFSDRLQDAHAPVELLDPLPYFVACRLCAILGRMARHGDCRERRSENVGIVDDSRRVGFELLSDKTQLLGFLSELNVAYLARKNSTKGNALYGELQDYLSVNLDVPELRPFVDVVREHAMNNLPIGPDDPFIGGGGVRRLHSLHSAMQETGVHSLTMRKILLERGVIGEAEQKMPDNKVVCTLADIESAVSDYRDSIHVQEIVTMLGIKVPTAARLIEAGALRPIYGSEKDDMLAKFSRRAVEALLRGFVENAEEREESESVVSLQYAYKRAGCQISDIILALIDGRISTRYLSKDTSKIGFDRILVDLAEVKAKYAPPCPGLKRHEFVRALGGIDHATGMAIMYSGFFKIAQAESKTNRRVHDIVTQESFDAFFSEHASLAELAKGWMKPWILRRALTKAGIRPVWASRSRRAATFYRRSEVESYRSKNP